MRKLFAVFLILFSFQAAAQKQSTITVLVKNLTVPVFIGYEKNIIKTITVLIPPGSKNILVSEIGFETNKYASSNLLKSIKVYSVKGKNDSLISELNRFKGASLKLSLKHFLSNELNSLKIALELKGTSSIDSLLKIKCSYIKIDGQKYPLDNKTAAFRIGQLIRKPGDYNVKSYRIPGLVLSNNGTLLAVYDIRKNSAKDLPADIDVGLSRSTDGGQNWQPMQRIIDMGEPHDQNGAGDPSILVDKQTGTVWVAALWSHGDRSWYGSKQGLTPEETGQLVLVKSMDDGLNWSKPESITPKTKNPKWNLFFQGPGNGISLNNGTLVFPAQFKDSSGMPFSTIIFSTDHGLNWKAGKGAKNNTTEAQVVELQNGDLMLNMRDNRGGSRSIAVTTDLGNSWIEHKTSRSELIEPICMASFIRVSTKILGKQNSILAFSNPASKMNRDSMTVKFSIDEGNDWGKVPSILIDERNFYGYSCLTKINDKYLGMLYEGEGEIFFVKVKIPDEATKVYIGSLKGGDDVFRIQKKK